MEIARSEKKWTLLNIVPLLAEHRGALCADTLDLYRRGCITETAFILTLVPEGNPPTDKVKILAEEFERFRAALGKTAMPVGILLQATMGHGWIPNSRSEFQRIVRSDGSSPYIFCPLDGDFRAYVRDAVRRLAALRPDFFMVDDDFRLLTGRDGCFCPLHLERFNRTHGTDFDREAMVAAVKSDETIAANYDELLKISLLELAGEMRGAINAADPEIPCSFCMCAGDTRHAPEIARTLAATGENPTVRINNARYLNESLRTVPEWMMFSARQVASLPEEFDILAEPDTFPQNRYSTSAAMMHLQLTGSILEGCRGGKLWLTRTRAYEPESGRRYRDILAEHLGFYRALAALAIEWTGAATVLPKTPKLDFPASIRGIPNITWSTQILGKMGIPFYFTKSPAGIVTLAESDCDHLDDICLAGLLSGHNCLLDGPAAVNLCKRGFSPLLGVEARPWNGRTVSFERTENNGLIPISTDRMTELKPLEGTQILSALFHTFSGVGTEEEFLMPGATFHENSDGGRVAVVAAPVLPYGYPAFGMLNETRKRQLLDLFRRLGGLPWHVPGDDEVLLRTGKAEGCDIAVLIDLSLDDISEIRLCGPAAKRIGTVEELLPDGNWKSWPFSATDSELRIKRGLHPLRPLVLRLSPELRS